MGETVPVRHVLIDENLLLDLLLDRSSLPESAAFVWQLIVLGQVRGYVTNRSLASIWHTVRCLKDRDIANQVIAIFISQLKFCPVDKTILERACSYDLNFSVAVQVTCVQRWELDGILALNPLDFYKAPLEGVAIFTPDQLIAEHLTSSLGKYPIPEIQSSDFINASHDSLLEVMPCERVLTVFSYHLKSIKVFCGGKEPRASVVIQTSSGKELREMAKGNGPIDAVYKAMSKALSQCFFVPRHQLVYTNTQATTSDSEVLVTILLQSGNSLFPGRGFHTDTVRAYADAYIDALGYLFRCSL